MAMSNIFTLILQDKDPIGIIPLENLCVRALQDSSKPVEHHSLSASHCMTAEFPHTYYLPPQPSMNHTAVAKWISSASAQNSESGGHQKIIKINKRHMHTVTVLHVGLHVCLNSSAWSYIILKDKRSRPARRRTKAEWSRVNTSRISSVQPAQRNGTTG